MEKDSELIKYLEHLNEFMSKTHPNNTRFYKTLYDFVLRAGKTYESTPLNKKELTILKDALNKLGEKPKKKQCFYNAQLLMLNDFTNTIKYVEGYASNIIVVAHGWNTINGKLIDVTWDVDGKPIIGEIPNSLAYMGVEFDSEIIRERIFSTGMAETIIDDFRSGYPLLEKKYVLP